MEQSDRREDSPNVLADEVTKPKPHQPYSEVPKGRAVTSPEQDVIGGGLETPQQDSQHNYGRNKPEIVPNCVGEEF